MYGRRQQRRRSGFGFWGPFPSYQRSGRRGSFRVSGCCLPLALTLTAAPAVGARAVWRRR
jgi:hypothetical protein